MIGYFRGITPIHRELSKVFLSRNIIPKIVAAGEINKAQFDCLGQGLVGLGLEDPVKIHGMMGQQTNFFREVPVTSKNPKIKGVSADKEVVDRPGTGHYLKMNGGILPVRESRQGEVSGAVSLVCIG